MFVLGENIPPELVGGFALVLVSLVLVLRLPLPAVITDRPSFVG